MPRWRDVYPAADIGLDVIRKKIMNWEGHNTFSYGQKKLPVLIGLTVGAWLGLFLPLRAYPLQNLTTKEPSDDQLEVAIHALQESLKLEPQESLPVVGERALAGSA